VTSLGAKIKTLIYKFIDIVKQFFKKIRNLVDNKFNHQAKLIDMHAEKLNGKTVDTTNSLSEVSTANLINLVEAFIKLSYKDFEILNSDPKKWLKASNEKGLDITKANMDSLLKEIEENAVDTAIEYLKDILKIQVNNDEVSKATDVSTLVLNNDKAKLFIKKGEAQKLALSLNKLKTNDQRIISALQSYQNRISSYKDEELKLTGRAVSVMLSNWSRLHSSIIKIINNSMDVLYKEAKHVS